jgi:diaminohydroxyphosphoribosylaminopyrimidine deaminase/5-amino-6-(5-phosphoribosylamino)uracil reductase
MMRAALALARRSLGRTWPNPAVGCVIVKDGVIVGRGRTRDGGRPHAEVDALDQAGDAARGATVYVTLEPCSHFGKSPPCADALIKAGVVKVVSAMEDPNPQVNGQGHARLRAAGIEVEVGAGAKEAAEINAGFLLQLRERRPLFHLKVASSLDGRIATASGESKWITGAASPADAGRRRATRSWSVPIRWRPTIRSSLAGCPDWTATRRCGSCSIRRRGHRLVRSLP